MDFEPIGMLRFDSINFESIRFAPVGLMSMERLQSSYPSKNPCSNPPSISCSNPLLEPCLNPSVKLRSNPLGQLATMTCHPSVRMRRDTWSRSGQLGVKTGSVRSLRSTSPRGRVPPSVRMDGFEPNSHTMNPSRIHHISQSTDPNATKFSRKLEYMLKSVHAKFHLDWTNS